MKISLEGFSIHVKDVEQSLAFYTRIPGATVTYHEPGHIALVSIGKNTLNLVRLDLKPSFHLEFEVDDVDEVYERFQRENFPTESQPENKPWGERAFHCKDPDGSFLEFAKTIK
jgi:catechol 2,3-dioxygenase-like lactoylglutathione lyase family enzyme